VNWGVLSEIARRFTAQVVSPKYQPAFAPEEGWLLRPHIDALEQLGLALLNLDDANLVESAPVGGEEKSAQDTRPSACHDRGTRRWTSWV